MLLSIVSILFLIRNHLRMRLAETSSPRNSALIMIHEECEWKESNKCEWKESGVTVMIWQNRKKHSKNIFPVDKKKKIKRQIDQLGKQTNERCSASEVLELPKEKQRMDSIKYPFGMSCLPCYLLLIFFFFFLFFFRFWKMTARQTNSEGITKR